MVNLYTNKNEKTHVIIIGAGGTGGWFASYIDRIKDDHIVTIIDGDVVESKNLTRQNFIESDINHNKAQVIGARYNFKNIVPQFLKNKDEVKEIVEAVGLTPLFIGAVDNNASRKLIKEFMDEYKGEAFWLDGGNSERDGQVITSIIDENGERVEGFSDPFELYEEFANTDGDERRPDQISCAEQSESAPQNVVANILSATTLFTIANKIMNNEPVLSNEIKFNSSMVSMYDPNKGGH